MGTLTVGVCGVVEHALDKIYVNQFCRVQCEIQIVVVILGSGGEAFSGDPPNGIKLAHVVKTLGDTPSYLSL